MRLTGDELAGVVDLFGALPPTTLEQGVRELAFRRGQEFDAEAHATAVEAAVDGYRLVRVTKTTESEEPLLTPGPTAFPELPEGAEDLPHILEAEQRNLDRGTVGTAAEQRLRAEAARAVANGEHDRVTTLLDVSYDLEAWAPVEIGDIRDRLDAALAGE
jgi:hypothetical protein